MTNNAVINPKTRLVDGVLLRYADSEDLDKPTVLFTSPWPESLSAFRHVWPMLAANARLVAVDLPGFGQSAGRPNLFSP